MGENTNAATLIASPLSESEMEDAVRDAVRVMDTEQEIAEAAGRAAVRAFCLKNGINLAGQ